MRYLSQLDSCAGNDSLFAFCIIELQHVKLPLTIAFLEETIDTWPAGTLITYSLTRYGTADQIVEFDR